MEIVKSSYIRWLNDQRNVERISNYRVYENYYSGQQDINIPTKIRLALESELGSVCNYCRVVVDKPVEYMVNDIHIVVKSKGGDHDRADRAERLLYEVYDDNGLLDEALITLLTLMGIYGDAFTKLYITGEKIKIDILRPELVYPKFASSNYREMIYCIIKWFNEDASLDYHGWNAQLFTQDKVIHYKLDGEQSNMYWIREREDWQVLSEEDNAFGFIPIVHFKNASDLYEFGISDLQVMLDEQDALNKILTDMLLTLDNQAFQRAVIFGVQASKDTFLTLEPGRITEVPNENARLQVIEPSPIQPFVEALEKVTNMICEITGIPRMALSRPDGFPISGYALRIHLEPLEKKCKRKWNMIKSRLERLNWMIFKAVSMLGGEDFSDLRSEVRFKFALPEEELTRLKIIEAEQRAKVKSRRTQMEELGIEDIEFEEKLIADQERAEMEMKINMEKAKADIEVEKQRKLNEHK